MADPSNHARLTLHDQIVVNYLGYLTAELAEGENAAAAIDVMRPALRHCNWGNPKLEPILRAATDLAQAFPSRRKPHGAQDFATAHLVARRALARFFFWRGALAHDAATQQPQSEDAA